MVVISAYRGHRGLVIVVKAEEESEDRCENEGREERHDIAS
jgi:hypothetical protein